MTTCPSATSTAAAFAGTTTCRRTLTGDRGSTIAAAGGGRRRIRMRSNSDGSARGSNGEGSRATDDSGIRLAAIRAGTPATTRRAALVAAASATIALLLSSAVVPSSAFQQGAAGAAFVAPSAASSPRTPQASDGSLFGVAARTNQQPGRGAGAATPPGDQRWLPGSGSRRGVLALQQSAVAADADMIIMEKMGKQREAQVGELNELYALSADEPGRDGSMSSDEGRTPKRPIRFRGISQSSNSMRKKRIGGSPSAGPGSKSKVEGRSRSSTMPGFSAESDRQRAYRDGLRLVEERTGRKVRETPTARRRRRKESGEAMYRNSASVPDSLVLFAEEIHQEDRITRAEEIELGEKTQEAIHLQNLYDNLEERLGREPTDEEWCAASGKINMEAIGQVIEDGLEAKNKLVTSNLRMVQSVVNTYIRNGLSAQYNAADMMQEGIVALIRAAEKFEPDRGWKFSTYAMYWVRASVKRNQIFQSRIVAVPPRVHENHKRLVRVQRELYAVLGRKPTKKELGDAVGLSELQVKRCFTAMRQKCYSLDQEIHNTKKPMMSGDAGRDTLIEIVESRTDDGEHMKQRRVQLRQDLVETLNRHLKPDEVELLLLRFGLHPTMSTDAGKQVPIIELSRMVGLKPDKIRRTINRSLKQLKSVGAEEWLSFERELQ